MRRFEPFYVIVCGGRDFRDRNLLNATLDKIVAERWPIAEIIHGNARGADTLAGEWARCHHVRVWPVPAEWSKYGRSAGPRRNKKMLGSGAKLVVAFPGGKGTRNMVKQARTAGIEVMEIAP